ncbi:hypothetical protein CFOL_v3_36284, partial [Cephalotus follicularis]
MSHLSMGEAHRRITEYLNRFYDGVSSQDGASLRELLSLSSNSNYLLSVADALDTFQDANRLIDNFSDFLGPLFRSLHSLRLNNLLDSYTNFEKAANAFIQEFRNWEWT